MEKKNKGQSPKAQPQQQQEQPQQQKAQPQQQKAQPQQQKAQPQQQKAQPQQQKAQPQQQAQSPKAAPAQQRQAQSPKSEPAAQQPTTPNVAGKVSHLSYLHATQEFGAVVAYQKFPFQEGFTRFNWVQPNRTFATTARSHLKDDKVKKCIEVIKKISEDKNYVYVLPQVGWLFEMVGDDHKEISSAATDALTAIKNALPPYATRQFLRGFAHALSSLAPATVKEVALNLLTNLCETFPLQVAQELSNLIPLVSVLMNDANKSVARTSQECMGKLCRTCGNSDLIGTKEKPSFIDSAIRVDISPSEKNTAECVENLAGCVFVQPVESSAISVMLPVLFRGLQDKRDTVVRRTCLIIENMCTVVEEPQEAYPFFPKILPMIQAKIEATSDPEARSVVQRAAKALQAHHMAGGRANVDALAAIVKLQPQAKKAMNGDFEWGQFLQDACTALVYCRVEGEDVWKDYVNPGVAKLLAPPQVTKLVAELSKATTVNNDSKCVNTVNSGADLFRGSVSLAYGTSVILRETKMFLQKGKIYGMIGDNGSGKTTFMGALADEKLEGFPKRDQLKCVFVEHDIKDVETGNKRSSRGSRVEMTSDLSGLQWLMYMANTVYKSEPKIDESSAKRGLEKLGFGMGKAAELDKPWTTYSGGYKMKLQLGAANLINADILLLDEPTSHLDVENQKWMKDWLKSFKGTVIVTSLDADFLNEMCSNLIIFDAVHKRLSQFESKKKGAALTEYVKINPHFEYYIKLSKRAGCLEYAFPPPGPLDGITSKTKAILTMKNVSFSYQSVPASAPGSPKQSAGGPKSGAKKAKVDKTHANAVAGKNSSGNWTVQDINLSLCLSSRVAIVGPNGSGKSTLLKLMIGEKSPDRGTVDRHSGCRIAYVAQDALHHLEQHMTKTASQYIMWRFQGNDDREAAQYMENLPSHMDEQVARKVKWCVDLSSGNVRRAGPSDKAVTPEQLMGRRKVAGQAEYDVKWVEFPDTKRTWVPRKELIQMGYEKLVCREDEKQAMEKGLMFRPLTQESVENHLMGFGLDKESASHTPMNKLAAGQKAKVVIGAAMWLNPHIVMLDEPTNYLDKDALGSLTCGLQDFNGAVILVTHNKDFAQNVVSESWVMSGAEGGKPGRLTREGECPVSEGDDKNAQNLVDLVDKQLDLSTHSNEKKKELKRQIKIMEQQLKTDSKTCAMTADLRMQIQDRIAELNEQLGY